jgi:hypothetical protein
MNIDSNAVERMLNEYEHELDQIERRTAQSAHQQRVAAHQQDAVVEIRKRFRALVSEAIQTPEQAVEAILGSPAPQPSPMPPCEHPTAYDDGTCATCGEPRPSAEDIESIARCKESYEGY